MFRRGDCCYRTYRKIISKASIYFGVNFANVALSKLSVLGNSAENVVSQIQNMFIRLIFLSSASVSIFISALSYCIVHIAHAERGKFSVLILMMLVDVYLLFVRDYLLFRASRC